jgi:hypothetical protein
VCLASERYETSSGRMEKWTDGRPDGMGTEIFDLSCNVKSSESALNSGIPVYSIFTHTSDFVQTQNEANNTNIQLYPHTYNHIHI